MITCIVADGCTLAPRGCRQLCHTALLLTEKNPLMYPLTAGHQIADKNIMDVSTHARIYIYTHIHKHAHTDKTLEASEADSGGVYARVSLTIPDGVTLCHGSLHRAVWVDTPQQQRPIRDYRPIRTPNSRPAADNRAELKVT